MRKVGEKLSLILLVVLLLALSASAVNYDVMSNGKEWFICDATSGAPLFADFLDKDDNYLSNYGTLTSVTTMSGDGWCSLFVPLAFDEDYYFGIDAGSGHECDIVDGVAYNYCCLFSQSGKYGQSDLNQYNVNDPSFNPDLDPFTLFQIDQTYGESGSCPVCYDDQGRIIGSGVTTTLPTGGGGFEYVPKERGGRGKYYGNIHISCHDNNGYLCLDVGSYCKNNYWSIAASDAVNGMVCCYGSDPNALDICIPATGSLDNTCADQGGEIMPLDDPMKRCDTLIDSSDTLNSEKFGCCKSGIIHLSFLNLAAPAERFICFQEDGNSYIGECCGDAVSCKNTFFDTLPFDSHNLFGMGSALHSIKTFNSLADGGVLIDPALKFTKTDGSKITISDTREISTAKFKKLSFDFKFEGKGTLDSVTLRLKGGGSCGPYVLKDQLSYNLNNSGFLADAVYSGNGVWYKVSLDFSGCQADNKSIEKIDFSYTLMGGPISIYTDDFYLSSPNSALASRFCSADTNQWVDSFNPSGTVDIGDISTWGPWSYACNSHLSMFWTGTHCCGSSSTKDNYGEYYADEFAGCYGGFPVYQSQRVSDALALPDTTSLEVERMLFFDGKFYICDSTKFDTLKESKDGSDSGPLFIGSSAEKKSAFDQVGAWVCLPGKGWGNFTAVAESGAPMQILAAKMKELAGTNDYSLHCGNKSVLNLNVSPDYYDNPLFAGKYVDVKKYCVLEIESGADKGSVKVGALVNSTNINAFLNANVKSFYYPTSLVNKTYNCTKFDYPFNGTYFFQQCEDTGNWLEAYYNKPFGIVIFNLKAGPGSGGVLGFLSSVWDGILDFFRNLFRMETTRINAMTIPGYVDSASFGDLYINKVGATEIKGMRDRNSIVITYTGFSDVSFLGNWTEGWFAKNSVSYKKIETIPIGSDTFVIGINGTGVYDFNWNYLTSHLRIVPMEP